MPAFAWRRILKSMTRVHKTDQEWRDQLSDEQYRVLRKKRTELPFSGEFVQPRESGEYMCAACGAHLFRAKQQHFSEMPGLVGWPSFEAAAEDGAVELKPATSSGVVRTEVICANCGSHLGHLFDDPTTPTGKHYCINSVCLTHKE